VVAAGFVGLAGFELALALGAPLGRAAMGGAHTYLPIELRIVAAVSALFWPLAALVVLCRGGYRAALVSARVARAGTWVVVGLLSLGVLMNLASSSSWKRFLQAPVAAVLAVICLMVARSGSGTGREIRNLPLERVRALIRDHIDPRSFGVVGQPRVNVLELNLALEQLAD
jgi:hypothetical protein